MTDRELAKAILAALREWRDSREVIFALSVYDENGKLKVYGPEWQRLGAAEHRLMDLARDGRMDRHDDPE